MWPNHRVRLAAAAHRGQQLVGGLTGQDQARVTGRLFQRFEQGIGRHIIHTLGRKHQHGLAAHIEPDEALGVDRLQLRNANHEAGQGGDTLQTDVAQVLAVAALLARQGEDAVQLLLEHDLQAVEIVALAHQLIEALVLRRQPRRHPGDGSGGVLKPQRG